MKEAYSRVAAVGCIACSQFLYAVFERPSKVLVAPQNAVTMDPWLVLKGTRWAKRDVLQDAKYIPTGSKLGDPGSV